MSLFRRSTPPARIEPAPPSASSDPPVKEVTLVLENERGRVGLFAQAERALGENEVLVQVKDLLGTRRSFRTVPLDPRARLVARELPVVLRGGLTAVASYYRVPADGLAAREEHYEGGEFSHAYDVTLRIVSRGRATEKTPVPA